MNCTRIDGCPMFALFKLEASLNLWRKRYCEADYNKCERYQLVLKSEDVPQCLLPNGKMLDGCDDK